MANDSLPYNQEQLKRCTRCREYKSLSDFNKSSSAKDGLQHRCGDCSRALCREWYDKNKDSERQKSRLRMRVYGPKQRERNRQWAAKNPDKARHHSRKKLLRKKYNMTVEEHEALFSLQGFACGACGSSEPKSRKGWSTDHCHKTGVVRGILCHHCNVGLGHAKDNIKVLGMWIKYLERPARAGPRPTTKTTDRVSAP